MKLILIGHWSFVGGIILAILAGLVNIAWAMTVLFILGLIVGFLNIKEKESTSFLVAVIALLVIGIVGLQLGKGGGVVASILNHFLAFASAAGIVVAIKQILAISQVGSE